MSQTEEQLFEMDQWRIYAVRAMLLHAKVMGLQKGVAFVCIQKNDGEMGKINYGVVNHTIKREPVDGKKGDIGTNYFGVVMSKLAVMMSLGLDSGMSHDALKYGEVPYRGGLVQEIGDFKVYVGFSGGTEDQDVAIAKSGMLMMTA
jgi:hypothetical protein